MLTLLAHLNGLNGQFLLWDDDSHVTRNPVIRALTCDNLRAMFTEPLARLYVPVTWLSLAVDYRVWGRDPFGYHLTNLALHLAGTMLVFFFVRRLTNQPAVALLTAALFGVHPLRVESVAWVTERKDVLFACLYLASLLAYCRWVTGRRQGYWWCFGFFVAAVLSKATAVTLPVMLLVFDALVYRRRAWVEKVPFLAVSLIVGLATVVAQVSGAGETLASVETIPVWARAGLVGYCALFYVGKFFWPAHLSAIYPTFDEFGWTPWHATGWLLLFLAVTAGLATQRRRWPVVWLGWLFYLVALLPTIGLAPVGIHVVADRYAYLALLGIMLAVSALVAPLVRVSLWVVLVGVLAVLTTQRTAVWGNTGTLFESVLVENPESLPAHINLSVWYRRLGWYDEAIVHGRIVVALAPWNPRSYRVLGRALAAAGRYREAIAVLSVPGRHHVNDPGVWAILGECYTAMGDRGNAALAHHRAGNSGALGD